MCDRLSHPKSLCGRLNSSRYLTEKETDKEGLRVLPQITGQVSLSPGSPSPGPSLLTINHPVCFLPTKHHVRVPYLSPANLWEEKRGGISSWGFAGGGGRDRDGLQRRGYSCQVEGPEQTGVGWGGSSQAEENI